MDFSYNYTVSLRHVSDYFSLQSSSSEVSLIPQIYCIRSYEILYIADKGFLTDIRQLWNFHLLKRYLISNDFYIHCTRAATNNYLHHQLICSVNHLTYENKQQIKGQGSIFNCLVLHDQQSESQRYSVSSYKLEKSCKSSHLSS